MLFLKNGYFQTNNFNYMKKILFAFNLFVVFLLLSFCTSTKNQKKQTMKISSPSFEQNSPIPSKFTCQGDNVNPQLNIEGVPSETKSLALIMDDPDAPRGTWVHWVVWNIEPDTKVIAENSIPPSCIEGLTDFGTQGYGGPCPPSGVHRYFFKLYALSDTLDLPKTTNKALLEKAMEGKIIAKAELIGNYQKK